MVDEGATVSEASASESWCKACARSPDELGAGICSAGDWLGRGPPNTPTCRCSSSTSTSTLDLPHRVDPAAPPV